MLLPDVNVLVYAHRQESPHYRVCSDWITAVANDSEVVGFSDFVLSGFLRVVTNPAVFRIPTPIDEAIQFLRQFRDHPTFVTITPGPRHWEIFEELCLAVQARGNLVPDAYFAALAIESGSEWITFDRDFARFPGLRWRRPFE